jgi:uncharacterized protein (DUF736 family)
VVLVVFVLAAAACGSDKGSKSTAATNATTTAAGPSVEIKTPADGATVKGNVVTLDLAASGIKIVKADGDTSGKTGHFHVFVDKEPVAAGQAIPKEAGIIHSTDDPLTVSGLKVGSHRLVVVLGDGTHTRIGGAQDEVNVTVEGPSVDATAPATLAAGQPLSIDVATEGVTLVKADGDTSGKTGHLHVFVDKDPAQFKGQPIPSGDPAIIHTATSPIVVTGLTPGEHTIWVVLGNGAHVAFDPPVMDKLTVTVT